MVCQEHTINTPLRSARQRMCSQSQTDQSMKLSLVGYASSSLHPLVRSATMSAKGTLTDTLFPEDALGMAATSSASVVEVISRSRPASSTRGAESSPHDLLREYSLCYRFHLVTTASTTRLH